VWVNQVQIQERPVAKFLWAMVAGRRKMVRAYTTLPLAEADMKALGVRIPYYQDWLVHDAIDDPWWEPLDWSKDVERTPPVSTLAGWYDIFLPGQLEDFRRLREAGRDARLTIGPWTHTSVGAGAAGIRDGLDWFNTHLRGAPLTPRRPVRYFVTGSKRWVEVEDWPPPFDLQRWNLQSDRRLSTEQPGESGPDKYKYDPADPAPGLGGPSLAGHRVRVQVSSAAHPLYARNLGGGEPLGTAATVYSGEQEIFHDTEHPSCVELPVSAL
jgi:putative CocE/NonD family hydrolase